MTTATLAAQTVNTTATTAALKVTAKTKVVLNDKAKQTKSANNGFNFVSSLAYARKEWQQNAYTKSNNELYKLLAECYANYLAMCADNAKAKELREQLDAYITTNKLVFRKGTHNLVKIVKCVFGDTDKRRISTYGIVLRTALAQGLKAKEVAAFIKDSGGVQEIKLARSNALTTKAKAEAVQTFLAKKVLAEVTSTKIAETLDASKVGQKVVFVATQKANGKFVINAVTESTGAVNTALAACYSNNKAKLSNKKAEQKAAANDAAINNAVNKAAA
jgi:hypothetical protein